MRISIWGTRGSLAAPGRETARFGGNTSCVQIDNHNSEVLVLDAGTGIRSLGAALPEQLPRVDVLLTHLHLDHIQGLGFFAPLFEPETEVHIWGPASTSLDLKSRLMRYLSPPLFPVRLRDLPCKPFLHELARTRTQIGQFTVCSDLVCHPGPTVGYRIECGQRAVVYLPDHEPALGCRNLNSSPEWISGCGLAEGVDLLIHDAQYTDDEYSERIGWGHSSLTQAFRFASLAGVKQLMPFHYDPTHDDETLDKLLALTVANAQPEFRVTPAQEGLSIELE
jgi:phosphoribosyl 1,2-cyclic phosphodiesterase